MLRWPFRSAQAPVESFFVQASKPVVRVQRTRERVLMRHLLSRFQTNGTEEEEQAGHRTLFACATAAIPPIFAAVMLYPAYHPIGFPPIPRPYWSKVGDEYLYVLYAFVTMAIAAVLFWESIFPDLLDVYALGTLPLSERLLRRVRWKAVTSLFGLVLVCVALPGALLLPAVAEHAHPLRHLTAHLLVVLAAGISAGAAVLALQAGIEVIFGTQRAKRILPVLQSISLLAVFLLLGATPRTLGELQKGTLNGRLPSVWFLAAYEQIKGGAPVSVAWSSLAWRAWLFFGISLLAVAVTYARAYERRVLYLVESGNAAVQGARMPRWFNRSIHSAFVTNAGMRATFHLMAQSAVRVSKLRTKLVIYVGIGLALVLSTSSRDFARALAIVSCAVVLGCANVMQTQITPRAMWLIHVLPKPRVRDHVQGSRSFVVLWSICSALLLLASFAATKQSGFAQTRIMLVACSAAFVLPAVLGVAALPATSPFPLSECAAVTPEHFVFTFLRNLVIVPGIVVSFGLIATQAAKDRVGTGLWCIAMAFFACALIRINFDKAPRG